MKSIKTKEIINSIKERPNSYLVMALLIVLTCIFFYQRFFLTFIFFSIITVAGLIYAILRKKDENNTTENFSIAGLFAIALVFYFYALIYLSYSFHDLDISLPKMVKGCMSPNEQGDAIGGIMNGIVGICISSFTALAFYAQYKANQQVKDQFLNEQIQTLVFKAIENKNFLISSTFGYGAENSLERIIKNLTESLENSIIKDFGIDIIHNPEKYEQNLIPNKFIKLLISRINEEKEIKEREEIYERTIKNEFQVKQILHCFIANESKQTIKENKIQGAYLLVQLLIQDNLDFVYSYITQINFIIQQIDKLNVSKEIYLYFFGTLKNEEICLLLYLRLYSISNLRGLNTLVLDKIDIDERFIQQLLKSNISLNYTNKLLVGEITIKQMIEEIKRIEKYCDEFPILDKLRE
jgi:hypothetical protein